MKLLIVDGDKLRHEGKDFGDFYDFGTHKQFPSIPVGTAVINGNLPDADFLAAVKQGVIEVSESGKAPEDKVYEDERQASLQARKEDPEAHQLYISRFYPSWSRPLGMKSTSSTGSINAAGKAREPTSSSKGTTRSTIRIRSLKGRSSWTGG